MDARVPEAAATPQSRKNPYELDSCPARARPLSLWVVRGLWLGLLLSSALPLVVLRVGVRQMALVSEEAVRKMALLSEEAGGTDRGDGLRVRLGARGQGEFLLGCWRSTCAFLE